MFDIMEEDETNVSPGGDYQVFLPRPRSSHSTTSGDCSEEGHTGEGDDEAINNKNGGSTSKKCSCFLYTSFAFLWC